MNKKYAIYSRKSKFTGKGESIENQIEMCKNEILRKDNSITEDDILIFEDEGYSGKNTNRPQFKKMMQAVRNREIKEIVCYRLDRISRNVSDCSRLIDELQDYGVGFNSISEHFDTSIPMGRAMYNICSTFAQLERETIAERIRDNMRELAKSGRWLGGVTPTGYKSEEILKEITIDGKKRKAFKLEIIPEEAEIVKLIFAKFIEFNSLTKVETHLIQNGIKTKNNKTFNRFSIRAILTNPVYMIADTDAWKYYEALGTEIFSTEKDFDSKHGMMAYNKTLQRSGKANVIRDTEEWIIAVGKHLGIITGLDWVKAQKLLQQNSSKSYHKPRNHTALLSGVLICGNCGAFMRPKMYNSEFKDGEKKFAYLCETKEKSRQCNCAIKNPNGNLLDIAVCDEIKKLAEKKYTFVKQLETAKKKILSKDSKFNIQKEALEKTVTEKKSEISTLIDSIAKAGDSVATTYLTDRINELHNELEVADAQLQEIKKITEENELTEMEFDILVTLLEDFASSFETLSIEQKRTAIRTFVKRVVWDGENVHMYLCGSDEDLDLTNFDKPLGKDSK